MGHSPGHKLRDNVSFFISATSRAGEVAYQWQKLNSNNEWEIRVVAVTFLSHFLNDKYVDEVIQILDQLKRPTYMSKMGIAWAFATIMAKYPEKMYEYLPHSSLDDWTYNKAICKMRESFRVKEEDKEKLKNMRRKNK